MPVQPRGQAPQGQGRPRQHQQQQPAGGGMPPVDVMGWFWSLPPITRTWFGLSLAINAAVSLELLQHDDMIFDYAAVASIKKLELWRCLTSFVYGGGLIHEFHVLLCLHMIACQSSTYETNPHVAGGGNPRTDYVFCLLFCSVLTVLTYQLQDYWTHNDYLYPLFTRTLLTCITYLWSRRNPTINVTFLFLPIQGQYLPFCHIGLALFLQNPLYELIHGMLVGHIYHYLVEVVPTMRGNGKRILSCPSILNDIVTDLYGPQEENRRIQPPQPPQQQQQAPPQQQPAPPQTTNNVNQDMQQRFQGEGATEAHIAAKMNRLERLRGLAMSADGRAEFTAKDNNGWQPIHEAVRGGYIEVVEFLVNNDPTMAGAGDEERMMINARTNHGISPLWLAEDALGLDHPVTKRLRELGAEKHGP